MSSGRVFRVGLAGWGLAGRYFHAPFIATTPGLELTAVVTGREVDHRLFPGVRVLPSFESLLAADDLDLVVIATPNQLHQEQALAALSAGRHVIVEKPVTATAAGFRMLMKAAEKAGRLLIPYQNRRWDGDFLTVKQLVRSGLLGPIHYFESCWAKYRPLPRARAGWKAEASAMSGVLYDLGPHLIDQLIQLFGRPREIWAQVGAMRPQGETVDWFRITLSCPGSGTSNLVALLEVDMLNPMPRPRFHVRGRHGTFEKFGLDPQEARLRAGQWPGKDNLGQEPADAWGRLQLSGGIGLGVDGCVETVPGDYGAFYRGVHAALTGEEPPPVDGETVLLQMEIIEAALQSAARGVSVSL